jgi:membrane protease YdiL (CAAX protease family)
LISQVRHNRVSISNSNRKRIEMATLHPFIDRAKTGKNQGWRYAIGLFIILLHLPVFFHVFLDYGRLLDLPADMVDYYANFLYRASALPVLLLVVRYLHQRPILTVLTAATKFRWNHMLAAFGVMLGLSAASEGLSYLIEPGNYYLSLNWAQFIPALLFGLIFITLQVLAEEALYRGYLLQAFGLATKNVPIAAVITTLLFAGPHWGKIEGDKVVSMTYFCSLGLLLVLTTLLDNGVEVSTGIHTANNIFSLLIVNSPSDSFPAPSVFSTHQLRFDWLSVLTIWASYLILLWILTKKYRWNWRPTRLMT